MSATFPAAIAAEVLCLSFLLTPAHRAEGHGTPIVLGAAAGSLVVSHAPDAFPQLIIGEDDLDGQIFDVISHPLLGELAYWELPGFEIGGLNSASSVSIAPIATLDYSQNPTQPRALWHWNSQSQQVQPTSATFHLLGTGGRFATIDAQAAPAPFLLADPIDGQQGFHNHNLLRFAIEKSAPDGVYGFFARMTSNQYAPSNSFLLVFNYRGNLDDYNQIAYDEVRPAALAIAAAALPGDYDHNGLIAADDYYRWKLDFGSTLIPFALSDGNGDGTVGAADYTVWRNHLGAAIPMPIAAAVAQKIPEPTAGALVALLATLLALQRCGR
jgi:hypothetical protein